MPSPFRKKLIFPRSGWLNGAESPMPLCPCFPGI